MNLWHWKHHCSKVSLYFTYHIFVYSPILHASCALFQAKPTINGVSYAFIGHYAWIQAIHEWVWCSLLSLWIHHILQRLYWSFLSDVCILQSVINEQDMIRTSNIVVCTPGRMLDHIEHAAQFNVDDLQILGNGVSEMTCSFFEIFQESLEQGWLGTNNQEIISLQFCVCLLENSADYIGATLSLCVSYFSGISFFRRYEVLLIL